MLEQRPPATNHRHKHQRRKAAGLVGRYVCMEVHRGAAMNTRNAMQLKALINNKAKAAHVSKHSYAADITFRETLDVVRDLTSVVFA